MTDLRTNRFFQASYRTGIAWTVLCLAWIGVVAVAGATLLNHAYQPSKTPSESKGAVSLKPSRSYKIVLFAHPFCPCTRATLTELSESLARLSHDVSVTIVFVSRGLNQEDVTSSSTFRMAGMLPGAKVVIDSGAEEASRFGATTSGEAFAFDPSGHMIYHGGLTPGRGHQGDAAGQTQLEQIIAAGGSRFCTAPIYGCQLPGSY